MSRTLRLISLLVLGFGLAVGPSIAEESVTAPPADAVTEGGGSQGSADALVTEAVPEAAPEVTPADPLALPATPDAVPAAPAPVAPPALKPITITFSGEVASVDAAGTMITIQDRYGVKKEISVPGEAKITAGADSKTLADLKASDKVTVEYTYDVATGKRTAQTIAVGEPAAAQAGS